MVKTKRFSSFDYDRESKCGEGLIEFLKKFDPIVEKYDVSRNKELKLNHSQYAEAERYDFSQQFGYLNKNHYSDILKNLKQVYDDEAIIESDVKVFHYVEKNIIHRYFGIPQLDKMFDEDYFEFEWDMHVEQNFSDHNTGWYRDHFIHQIRNFRMMYSLLKDFGFEKAIRSIFECRVGRNSVAKYVREKRSEFIYSKNFSILEELDEIVRKNSAWKEYFRTKEDGGNDNKEYYDDYFYSYVILASSALAALFHDMGYPICHFLTVRQRTSSYNPTMYMFTHNAIDSFDQLASKLSSSLLFNVVPANIIQDRLSYKADKKRYDHGVYSAVAFLLQFYDNGLIYSLSPEKQCAIEVAALAIFNHTEKFRSIEEGKGTARLRYQTIVFKQNPIAFLLRFCDDLQEWDRQYFEISKASDLLFCEKCGTPLIGFKKDQHTQLREYGCYCGKSGSNNLTRPDIFIKRKLYLVCVANSVNFSQKEKPEKLEVEIDYDYYKLLLLSRINPTYAVHRNGENGGVGKLLKNQNFHIQSLGQLEFSNIEIKYFVTANPLLIKVKILEDYLDCHDQKFAGSAGEFAEWLIIDVFGKKIPDFYDAKKNPEIVWIINFYYQLLQMCKAGRGSSAFIKKMKLTELKDPVYEKIMDSLVTDCYKWHESRAAGGSEDEKDRKSIQTEIIRYTDPERPFNAYKPGPQKNGRPEGGLEEPQRNIRPFYIGFYQDIYIFYEMNEKIKEARKQKQQKEAEAEEQ